MAVNTNNPIAEGNLPTLKVDVSLIPMAPVAP